ncbi:MAG TPA: hypothetical protein VEL73_03880 [Mycobacteriales bacterium]|nr:hypothetical protein [Mycobacteriales bacterium]
MASRRDVEQDLRDKLAEGARITLVLLDRKQITDEAAVRGLVRDAFGSADRLRAAAAQAGESGRPAAEVDLLERAVDRAEHPPPPEPPRWEPPPDLHSVRGWPPILNTSTGTRLTPSCAQRCGDRGEYDR